MFFISQDYFFFFFVTCSWFVLNSANDFSKILALSCLRSRVAFLCGTFQDQFSICGTWLFAHFRKGMASVSTVAHRAVHRIVTFLCCRVCRARALLKTEDGTVLAGVVSNSGVC